MSSNTVFLFNYLLIKIRQYDAHDSNCCCAFLGCRRPTTPLTVSFVGFTEVKLSHSKELWGLHVAPNIHKRALSPLCRQECKIYVHTSGNCSKIMQINTSNLKQNYNTDLGRAQTNVSQSTPIKLCWGLLLSFSLHLWVPIMLGDSRDA